jgi:hypothetical protein
MSRYSLLLFCVALWVLSSFDPSTTLIHTRQSFIRFGTQCRQARRPCTHILVSNNPRFRAMLNHSYQRRGIGHCLGYHHISSPRRGCLERETSHPLSATGPVLRTVGAIILQCVVFGYCWICFDFLAALPFVRMTFSLFS